MLFDKEKDSPGGEKLNNGVAFVKNEVQRAEGGEVGVSPKAQTGPGQAQNVNEPALSRCEIGGMEQIAQQEKAQITLQNIVEGEDVDAGLNEVEEAEDGGGENGDKKQQKNLLFCAVLHRLFQKRQEKIDGADLIQKP